MNFENLKVAVNLNKSEPPSLSMAFHMIQSLIKDIETESGTKFKNVVLGDMDQFPVLLAGQCRMLKSVYENSVDLLTRNQDRLAELNNCLSKIQGELDQNSNLSQEIAEKETEYQSMQKQKQQLLNDKDRYEKLSEQYNKLLTDIESIGHHDVNAKEKEVQELQTRYDDLFSQDNELNQKIKKLKSDIALLETDLSAKENEKGELEKKKNDLDTDLTEVKKAITGFNEIIPDLNTEVQEKQKQCDALIIEKQNLEQQKDELVIQLTAKQEEYNKFYREFIEPLQKNIDDLTIKVNKQNDEKKNCQDRKNKLQNQSQTNLTDIANLQQNISDINTKISEQNTLKSSYEIQKDQLDRNLNDISSQALGVQKEIFKLENDDIPNAKKALETSLDFKKAKQAELNKINTDTNSTNNDIASIKQNIETDNQTLKQKKQDLSELRTKHNVNSEEISKLESQLEELKGKTDKEKVETLRNQLERDIEELKKLREEEKSLTIECGNFQKSIKDESDTVNKLKNNKLNYEKQTSEVERSVKELEYFNTEEFFREFNRVKGRIALINNMKEKLFCVSDKLAKVVCNKKEFDLHNDWSRISADLQEIDSYISGVQKNILDEVKKFFAEGEL